MIIKKLVLRDENTKLQKRIEEYHEKMVKLQKKEKNYEKNTYELRSLQENFAKTLSEKELEFTTREGELLRKHESNENSSKINMKQMYKCTKILKMNT